MGTTDEKPTAIERPAPRDDLPAAERVRYEGGAEIARGGMGRVVEATDTLLGRTVAVKEALTADPELLRRFARETRITAKLEHPSIVPVYDASGEGEPPYYVMRKVSGRPLSDLIDAAETLDARLALVPNVLAAAQAIAHAHDRGIIHRDIKPSNILVGELGETVVIDWGLAKEIGEADDKDPHAVAPPSAGESLHTRVGVVFGTPGFMSPAQLRGEANDPRGDVYALGATLFFLLARHAPHHSADTTELMELAAAKPPPPIANEVPGVPAELSTIVDKALAFEEDDRYKDASAFAEDLKRFLTGQLVASHHYSRRERLFRFVRKHRAAVLIGTSAVIVLAVVGSLAISRVISERNRADDQARRAEAALASAKERADQLLLNQARTLADTNPTEAIAALKQLGRDSKRLEDARAIARSAVVGGVAWRMPGPDALTLQLALDATGRYLLQVTRDGGVRVWDLAEHRLVRLHAGTPEYTRAVWVLRDTRVLIYDETRVALLDWQTGAVESVEMPTMLDATATTTGERVAFMTRANELGLLDVTARKATLIWPGHRVNSIEMPRDGGWVAAVESRVPGSDGQVVVLDPSGRELTRYAGRIGVMAASQSRRLAVDTGNEGIAETEVAPGSTWRLYSTPSSARILELIHDGEEKLLAVDSAGRILVRARNGADRLVAIGATSGTYNGATVVAGEDLVRATNRGIELFSVIRPPVVIPLAVRNQRLAARAGARRIALSYSGGLMVFQLAHSLSSRIEIGSNMTVEVIDDDTLLEAGSQGETAWLDLATNAETKISGVDSVGLPQIRDIDSTDSRVLLVYDRSVADAGDSAFYVLQKGQRRPVFTHIATASPFARLVPGGGIVFTEGTTLYGVTAGVTSELGVLDEPVEVLVAVGTMRYAAATRTTIVRGSLTGPMEKITPPAADTIRLAPEKGGAVIVAVGSKLFRWTDRLVELGAVPGEIQWLASASGGVVIKRGGTFHFVELGPPLVVHPLTGSAEALLALDGKRLVTRNMRGRLEIVELPSRTHWEIPISTAGLEETYLAPDGQTIVQRTGGENHVWQLPALDGPILEELEKLTNATLVDGVLSWPETQSAGGVPGGSPIKSGPN